MLDVILADLGSNGLLPNSSKVHWILQLSASKEELTAKGGGRGEGGEEGGRGGGGVRVGDICIPLSQFPWISGFT